MPRAMLFIVILVEQGMGEGLSCGWINDGSGMLNIVVIIKFVFYYGQIYFYNKKNYLRDSNTISFDVILPKQLVPL